MMITDKNFEKEVLESTIPVFVEFWGSWCPPCQREKEVIRKLEKVYAGKVKIGELNVDRNPLTALTYSIKGVPAYILFHYGRTARRGVGAKSGKQLRQMIEEALGIIDRSKT